jgi:nucleoside-diphosphate-sugar epimerase
MKIFITGSSGFIGFHLSKKLLNFINALEKELGIKAIRNYMPMQKGDVKATLSDINLLKKLTGYNSKTNYKVGIRKFVEWYLFYYKKLQFYFVDSHFVSFFFNNGCETSKCQITDVSPSV